MNCVVLINPTIFCMIYAFSHYVISYGKGSVKTVYFYHLSLRLLAPLLNANNRNSLQEMTSALLVLQKLFLYMKVKCNLPTNFDLAFLYERLNAWSILKAWTTFRKPNMPFNKLNMKTAIVTMKDKIRHTQISISKVRMHNWAAVVLATNLILCNLSYVQPSYVNRISRRRHYLRTLCRLGQH